MKPEELRKYLTDREKIISRENYENIDFEINGKDLSFRDSLELDKPLYHPRRRRGS